MRLRSEGLALIPHEQAIRYSGILEPRMTRTRRASDRLADEAVDAAVIALRAADIEVVSGGESNRIDALVDGRALNVVVEVVSYCTGQRARDLIRQRRSRRASAIRLVVADRITAEAKLVLGDAGWSWLDRRGRMHLRGPGVRVDLDVPSLEKEDRSGGRPIAGRGGITVAYWLCEHPGESMSPTRSAPWLRLAPSTISTSVRRLAEAGLVSDKGTGIFPELFWELASAWRFERTWLLAAPDPARHDTVDSGAPRWRRTGTVAAVAYGAPAVTTEGGPIELYVPGPVDVSIAVRRYGAARPGVGAAVIAVAPVSAVVAGPSDVDVPILDGWPASPVLAVALDLAQDRARGREILTGWEVHGAVWQ